MFQFQNQNMGPTQFGYDQAPGGQYGYYEQQTPAGSFGAANQQWARGPQPVQAQSAMSHGATNPFLGQTSQGAQAQGSVLPYAQQIAQAGQQTNPYLGQTSQQAQGAGSNPFGANNPYLTQAIDSASADATRNFQTAVQPALAAAARASGSFGNTAVGEMERNAYSDFGRNLGNIANSARMQDYTAQQQLAENALNRTQANNQFNAGLSAADLARNLGGFFQGQGLGMQGLGQQLGAAQFDASLGNNNSQFNASLGANDLSRNAQLAQGLSQFNAGQFNQMGQFNTGQLNNMGQFNAQLGQNMAQFNAGQGNALNQFNTGQANQMLSQYRNLDQQQRQFDENFDFNAWRANNDVMRQGQQDQMAFINQMLNMNGQGLNLATQQQNTPLNYWQQFMQAANSAGGLGGGQTQNLQGNPWLGAIGGWLAMNGMLGNGQGG